MEHRDVFLLECISDYCNRTVETLARLDNDYDKFASDEDVQEVCAFRALQIGELVSVLSDTFKNSHPEIPWHEIVGLRNMLVHDYGKIETKRMWDTITSDFPALNDFCKSQIQ